MKPQDILGFLALIVCVFFAFLLGYRTGIRDIRELEDAGYEIVKCAVRHGEFTTNWVEIVKKGETK